MQKFSFNSDEISSVTMKFKLISHLDVNIFLLDCGQSQRKLSGSFRRFRSSQSKRLPHYFHLFHVIYGLPFIPLLFTTHPLQIVDLERSQLYKTLRNGHSNVVQILYLTFYHNYGLNISCDFF